MKPLTSFKQKGSVNSRDNSKMTWLNGRRHNMLSLHMVVGCHHHSRIFQGICHYGRVQIRPRYTIQQHLLHLLRLHTQGKGPQGVRRLQDTRKLAVPLMQGHEGAITRTRTEEVAKVELIHIKVVEAILLQVVLLKEFEVAMQVEVQAMLKERLTPLSVEVGVQTLLELDVDNSMGKADGFLCQNEFFYLPLKYSLSLVQEHESPRLIPIFRCIQWSDICDRPGKFP